MAAKKSDVEWNKDGRPVNWNGKNWPLFSRTMMRYLACYQVADNDKPIDDICIGAAVYADTIGEDEERRFMRQELLLAKLISSSLSCTLAQQVMQIEYGSEMWTYLSTRFEGRENEMTTLYTQRALRQKLEGASCRPGADVENHLIYMMNLREQLKALDADVSDAWMVDFMVRSISQLSYYRELKMMMLTGGICSVRTPDQVKAMIIVLDKEELMEKQLQARNNERTRNQGRGGQGDSRGNMGKQLPNNQQRAKNQPNSRNGGAQKALGSYKKKTPEQQKQFEEDRESRNCYACHKPGHRPRDCLEEMKPEPDASGGNGNGNALNQANFTVSSGVHSSAPQGPAQKQEEQSCTRNNTQSKKQTAAGQVKSVYNPETWVLDNGATQHLVGDKRYFEKYRDLTPKERGKATVHGYNCTSSPVGIGSIDLWVNVDGFPVVIRLDNVYYSPQRTNLLSQSIASEQGFQIAYDDAIKEYTLSMNGEVALVVKMQRCKLWIFAAENDFLPGKTVTETPKTMINYALSDGVADLQCGTSALDTFALNL